MYNYLNDAMNIEFSNADEYKICDCNKKCKDRVTICGECYQDPDAISYKLYEDMCIIFKDFFKSPLHVKGSKRQ
ncbi:hypothetical protein [Cellulosilyticum ruminicola]|uniref:hypothetical protein n=1 Tax=Cellulosilyticum ruminicola TaxID=425254 RepID=UPI0006CF5790|nr:hypothetical protein [Cellulosilyticum ruminicola]